MADESKLFSAREAAEYCGINYKHMRDITRDGQVKHFCGGTSSVPRYKYKRAWLDDYIAKRLGQVVEAKE